MSGNANNAAISTVASRPRLNPRGKLMRNHWQLYVFVAIPLLFIIVFAYLPMYGVVISFQNYKLTKGVMGSSWVGLKHFQTFFSSKSFGQIISNTLVISLESIVIGFPFPILLALMLNEVGNQKFKKSVQMITYAPYFISTVVLVSMVLQFFAPMTGIVNMMLKIFGGGGHKLHRPGEVF